MLNFINIHLYLPLIKVYYLQKVVYIRNCVKHVGVESNISF